MKNLPIVTFLIVFSAVSMLTIAQELKIPIYTGVVPNAKTTGDVEKIEKKDITLISHVQIPEIAVYLPSGRNATGQAVIICPGGGYWVLAYDWEGSDIARYFNSVGVAAIVLKYRLPVYGSTIVPHKAPLMDAQRAMRLVRFNASAWKIDPDKIGIMGFSAGGHLASTLGTHFDYGNPSATDSVERISCRPDFMILVYPVISFIDSAVHSGSSEALLGKDPDNNLLTYYSNELQVKEDTPPAFMIHADNDKGVPVENTLLMYKALRSKGISAELHILSEGEHGFGLGTGNQHIASWTNSLKLWLDWLIDQCGDTTKIKSKKALHENRDQKAKLKDYTRYHDVFELIRSEFIALKVDGSNVYNVKTSSFSLTMQVLYVVDDVVVADISYVTPADIESIEFFDDYRAAAYGMRGANGVLKIKQKSR